MFFSFISLYIFIPFIITSSFYFYGSALLLFIKYLHQKSEIMPSIVSLATTLINSNNSTHWKSSTRRASLKEPYKDKQVMLYIMGKF